MNLSAHQREQNNATTWREVMIESAIGNAAGAAAIGMMALSWYQHGHVTHTEHIVIGGLILIALVLAMNGCAKLDLITPSRFPALGKSDAMQWFTHISNEGESVGIAMTITFYASWQAFSGHKIEADAIAGGMALTLFGIMSGAKLIQNNIAPVLYRIERTADLVGLGREAVIFCGSVTASVIGEPAAASVLGGYFKGRELPGTRERAAAALAATIGSGGTFLWFAAPPILIVQSRLESVSWTLQTLIMMVGLPAGLQVLQLSIQASKYFKPLDASQNYGKVDFVKLSAFALLVLAHIPAPIGFMPMELMPLVYGTDALVGLYTIGAQWSKLTTPTTGNNSHESQFMDVFLPAILAMLLIGLELAGHISEVTITFLSDAVVQAPWGDGVRFLAGLVQVSVSDAAMTNLGQIALVIGLFLLTACVSAVADNALASTVIIAIPLSMLQTEAVSQGMFDCMAAAVLQGAVYGGVLLPPSNLPNFKLKRDFNVASTGEWLQGSIRMLWSGWVFPASLLLFWAWLA